MSKENIQNKEQRGQDGQKQKSTQTSKFVNEKMPTAKNNIFTFSICECTSSPFIYSTRPN
jgi:hypothetical protein